MKMDFQKKSLNSQINVFPAADFICVFYFSTTVYIFSLMCAFN